MHACMSSTSFAVLINGDPSTFFKTLRRLQQGDPLSPLLFIIVMKALNGLMIKAKDLQLVREVSVGRGDNTVEISHLFFADDTLIFYHSDVRILLDLRCVILCFQAVSGLNINLNKSELVIKVMRVVLLGCWNAEQSVFQSNTLGSHWGQSIKTRELGSRWWNCLGKD